MTRPDAHPNLRGVSGRQGIFLTGKPQQLLVFADGLVIVQVARLVDTSPIGASDVTGVTAGSGEGSAFAARTRRSRFLAYGDITRAELVNASVGQHRLMLTMTDGASVSHAYQPRKVDASAVLAALRERLHDRFVSSVAA